MEEKNLSYDEAKHDLSEDLGQTEQPSLDIAEPEEQNTGCCFKVYPAGCIAESKILLQLSWPIVLTQICQMIMGPISLIFCGHLGDEIQLDGAALSITFINVTCVAIAQGLGTSCDTFFSQCYGSKQMKLVGVYVQRALIIFTLILMLVYAFHINMESFLLAIGQNPEVARLCGNYMLVFMPGSFFFFTYVVLSKYIQNQNIVWPNVIIGLIANLANGLLHYILLYKVEMGLIGSAISQSIGYFLMAFLTLCFIIVTGRYKLTWGGWSLECLEEWGFFCRLALPGMLMVCMEWWGFEIGTLLTGILGTTELGAQAVILQIDSVWFQIPFGLQIASSQRIGQYLGSQNVKGAITVSRLIITIIGVSSFIMSGIIFCVRYELAALFTNVDEVVQLAGDLLPIVCLYMFFDGLAAACKGVLFGTGRQLIGSAILFVSYYCIALPIGIPLMFLTEMRSAAYWWALAINLVIQALVLNVVVFKTDWHKQVEKAHERAGLFEKKDDYSTFDTIDEQEPLISNRKKSRGNSISTPSPRIRRLSHQGQITSLRDDEVDVLHQHRDSIGLVPRDSYVSIDGTSLGVPRRNVQMLILKRLATVLCVIAILVAGIILRLTLEALRNENSLHSSTTESTPFIMFNRTEELETNNYSTVLIKT